MEDEELAIAVFPVVGAMADLAALKAFPRDRTAEAERVTRMALMGVLMMDEVSEDVFDALLGQFATVESVVRMLREGERS